MAKQRSYITEDMLDKPEEELICRIFEQALDDYRTLRQKNITQDKDMCSVFSIKDIEKFFTSSWCDTLLSHIGSKLSGHEILSRVQAQCA